MPIYVAMLRGINVGPHKRIKMDQLRQSFESLGFEQVQTYIQSGNVIFKSVKASPAALSRRIEKQILADFGFPVPAVIRTADEIGEAVVSNPYLNRAGMDPEKLHVMFLSDALTPAAVKKLAALTTPPDQSLCVGKEIYLHLPNGVAESKLMKAPFDRALAVITTARNWKTMNTLHQMCQDCR
jgi:uncharacterized protein (DUF1697 family)